MPGTSLAAAYLLILPESSQVPSEGRRVISIVQMGKLRLLPPCVELSEIQLQRASKHPPSGPTLDGSESLREGLLNVGRSPSPRPPTSELWIQYLWEGPENMHF